MSKANILGAIQKLESFMVETQSIQSYEVMILEDVLNELRMMLNLLRDNESRGRSRLNYLLADYAEMAQDSVDLSVNMDGVVSYSKIFDALDWMRETRKRMMEFGVTERLSRPQSDGDGGVVVGLEKDVQQLIGKVILSEELHPLVAVCVKGMVGVGKTTLARKVYNHAAVVEKFKRRAWLCISSDTSEKEVLVKLIQQLVEVDGDSLLLEEMDNQSLQQMLRLQLQGMPYFIVLDNLLLGMHFRYMFGGLPNEGNGSRLLITSRFKVNKTHIYYTHEMKALDSEKSWQLFLDTIEKYTGDEIKFSKELERKGKEMLKKCGGLPIAIIDVGRQKAKQRLSGIEWEELFDSIDLGESLKSLEPMYHDLDEELKACFLHMSFFKENAIIREEKLEHIWAACGVETGRSPCYRLVNHSIIEVVHPYPRTKRVKRCRMNPLLHMLSIKKAEGEISFEILRSNGNNQLSQSPRHRVIHCGRDKFIHSTNQDDKNLVSLILLLICGVGKFNHSTHKHLVSLIFHGGGRYLEDTCQSYWKSFELLKILDMEDFGLKTLSDSIGTLKELRYLGLRNNYLQEIPHSFGGLKMLEVLDVALNFMVEVPDIINEMVSLRHLYMSDVIHKKPLKGDALRNLEALTYISIYDWTYEVSDVKKMTCLHKLGIEEIDENADVSKLFQSLALLQSLDHLILKGFRFRNMPAPCFNETGDLDVFEKMRTLRLDGRLARLPSANNFPDEIEYLVLVNTCLDEDPMPVLENMLSLRHLKMRNAYNGREMVIQHNNLKLLCISELWNLRKLQIGEYAMYSLKHLEIMNCPHLETLPQQIQSMEHLRKFKMVTTKHIATKIRNSGLISRILEVDISP